MKNIREYLKPFLKSEKPGYFTFNKNGALVISFSGEKLVQERFEEFKQQGLEVHLPRGHRFDTKDPLIIAESTYRDAHQACRYILAISKDIEGGSKIQPKIVYSKENGFVVLITKNQIELLSQKLANPVPIKQKSRFTRMIARLVAPITPDNYAQKCGFFSKPFLEPESNLKIPNIESAYQDLNGIDEKNTGEYEVSGYELLFTDKPPSKNTLSALPILDKGYVRVQKQTTGSEETEGQLFYVDKSSGECIELEMRRGYSLIKDFDPNLETNKLYHGCSINLSKIDLDNICLMTCAKSCYSLFVLDAPPNKHTLEQLPSDKGYIRVPSTGKEEGEFFYFDKKTGECSEVHAKRDDTHKLSDVDQALQITNQPSGFSCSLSENDLLAITEITDHIPESIGFFVTESFPDLTILQRLPRPANYIRIKNRNDPDMLGELYYVDTRNSQFIKLNLRPEQLKKFDAIVAILPLSCDYFRLDEELEKIIPLTGHHPYRQNLIAEHEIERNPKLTVQVTKNDILTSDGIPLNAYEISQPKNKEKKEYLIHCHGNYGTCPKSMPGLAKTALRHDLKVVSFDYQGYGLSLGEIEIKNHLYQCALAVGKKCIDEGATYLLVDGFSLGGAVAAKVVKKLQRYAKRKEKETKNNKTATLKIEIQAKEKEVPQGELKEKETPQTEEEKKEVPKNEVQKTSAEDKNKAIQIELSNINSFSSTSEFVIGAIQEIDQIPSIASLFTAMLTSNFSNKNFRTNSRSPHPVRAFFVSILAWPINLILKLTHWNMEPKAEIQAMASQSFIIGSEHDMTNGKHASLAYQLGVADQKKLTSDKAKVIQLKHEITKLKKENKKFKEEIANLKSQLYLGLRQPRVKTEDLFSFVDELVAAVQEVFPKCCIHFEDWTGKDAIHLLERYRNKYCVYNDDVQGTAGIVLAGMINATKIKGTQLKDEKFLFLGAGSAAIGLANLLCSALVQQGMTLKEAQARVYMFDINGLLESSRKDLFDFQLPYAHTHAPTNDFVSAIESIKPTTIIGVSTVGGAFTQKVVEAMSKINQRPVILALSNPTDHAECTPEQAYTWSKGQAIYAAGVQFHPVHYNNQTFLPGQANNFYIFPAIGMAIFATQAKLVTDEMFIEAAKAVADQVSPDYLKQGLLYPLQSNVLEVETQTAARVAKLVFDSGLARVGRPKDILQFIREHVYKPKYNNYA